jgi:hypothetical protein
MEKYFANMENMSMDTNFPSGKIYFFGCRHNSKMRSIRWCYINVSDTDLKSAQVLLFSQEMQIGKSYIFKEDPGHEKMA